MAVAGRQGRLPGSEDIVDLGGGMHCHWSCWLVQHDQWGFLATCYLLLATCYLQCPRVPARAGTDFSRVAVDLCRISANFSGEICGRRWGRVFWCWGMLRRWWIAAGLPLVEPLMTGKLR